MLQDDVYFYKHISALNFVMSSGHGATIEKISGGFKLNWQNVFEKIFNMETTYDVSVGTTPGSSDIFRETGLQNTACEVYYVTELENVVHVVIRAMFPTTTYQVYTTNIIVPH